MSTIHVYDTLVTQLNYLDALTLKRLPEVIIHIWCEIVILQCSVAEMAHAQRLAKARWDIPIKRLIIDSCRSSGPGGQHVNKKNTKVSVSFHLPSADWLPDETREKLGQIHKANLNKDGFLTIRSDKTRSQTLNIADCMDKLRAYLSEAEQPPEPEESLETIELRRQRLERAAAERLKSKRIRGTMIRQALDSKNII